jgi:D-xylose transport system substrate-binding protein
MFGIKKAITCIALAMMSMAPIAAAEDIVAMLLPENVNPRWESQDAAFFVKHMKDMAPNIQVEVFNANNDTAAQQRQAEQALSRGAKVLVVIPIDGEAAAIIADMASDEGVPTIAYDRMVQSTNTSFWVQADLRASGRAQAAHIVANTKFGDTLVMLKGSPTDPNAPTIYHGQMDVLESLYASGERILGYENWTQGWDPAVARRSMDQALTKLNNNVQGVVSSNDGNAGAAVAALSEQGMAGNVPVSGLDCTVQALQLILLDQMTQSVWRDFDMMAEATAKATVALINEDSLDGIVMGTSPANSAGKEVPMVPVGFYNAVGEAGVQYVIDNDPSITKADVCKGEAAATSFCKG